MLNLSILTGIFIILLFIFVGINIIIKKLKKIEMTSAEELAFLQALKSELDAAKTRILQKISDLETQIANAGQTTPEIDQALSDLKTSADGLDGIVPAT